MGSPTPRLWVREPAWRPRQQRPQQRDPGEAESRARMNTVHHLFPFHSSNHFKCISLLVLLKRFPHPHPIIRLLRPPHLLYQTWEIFSLEEHKTTTQSGLNNKETSQPDSTLPTERISRAGSLRGTRSSGAQPFACPLRHPCRTGFPQPGSPRWSGRRPQRPQVTC